MRKELVVATKNAKKLTEIRQLLKGLNFKITSLADYPDAPRIIENGETFKENAVKKALTISRYTHKLTLGEDSGLCVDALGGKPGIYSSRFAGKHKSDLQNNRKLLAMLSPFKGLQRKAGYVCAVALADGKGFLKVFEGRCSGYIGHKFKGRYGFGYDPLFIIPRYQKTFAQLGPSVKHRISHRFRALKKARHALVTYLRKNP